MCSRRAAAGAVSASPSKAASSAQTARASHLAAPPLLPAHRLRATRDFERLRAEGRTWGHRLLAIQTLERGGEITRCGFVVSRRIGPSVVRNRVKRRLREVVRALLPRLQPGWDLSINARQPAALVGSVELRDAVEETARRAGALRD